VNPPSVHQFVAQADVGESAADHDFVIAAARAVGVEVGGLDAVLLQIFSGGAVFLDRAGGRDVVGGNAVAQHRQHAGRANSSTGEGLSFMSSK
jgi:hypothetical protein